MLHIPTALFVALVAAPLVSAGYIRLKLSEFQRDPNKILWRSMRAFRPDQYTDEGQDWLRWLWILAILTVPWWVTVALVFGKWQ